MGEPVRGRGGPTGKMDDPAGATGKPVGATGDPAEATGDAAASTGDLAAGHAGTHLGVYLGMLPNSLLYKRVSNSNREAASLLLEDSKETAATAAAAVTGLRPQCPGARGVCTPYRHLCYFQRNSRRLLRIVSCSAGRLKRRCLASQTAASICALRTAAAAKAAEKHWRSQTDKTTGFVLIQTA